jgi:hypothetical protein
MDSESNVHIRIVCVCGETFEIEARFTKKAIEAMNVWKQHHEKCYRKQQLMDGKR